MRSAILLLATLISCDAPSSHGSEAPSHKTYPPSPGADDVDAFGSAKDPEIAGCMRQLDNRRGFASTLVGESSVKENRSDDWRLCWCKSHGNRGMRADGSCLP